VGDAGAEREFAAVRNSLDTLRAAARDVSTNLLPAVIECALAYATIGEICDTLREVFGVADYV